MGQHGRQELGRRPQPDHQVSLAVDGDTQGCRWPLAAHHFNRAKDGSQQHRIGRDRTGIHRTTQRRREIRGEYRGPVRPPQPLAQAEPVHPPIRANFPVRCLTGLGSAGGILRDETLTEIAEHLVRIGIRGQLRIE